MCYGYSSVGSDGCEVHGTVCTTGTFGDILVFSTLYEYCKYL